MDYLREFSKKAADRVQSLISQRDKLTQTIDQTKKNLESEQALVQKLKGELEKLNTELTDDSQSFQEFKDSLSKLDSDIEKAERACETLQEIIPQKTTALQTVRSQIKGKLKAFFAESKPIIDKEIRDILDLAAAERAAFVDAFGKFYEAAGIGSLHPFTKNKVLHKAYIAFGVSPKRSRPKQPEPVQAEQPEAKTLLTGESEPAEPVAPAVEPGLVEVKTPKLAEVKNDGY